MSRNDTQAEFDLLLEAIGVNTAGGFKSQKHSKLSKSATPAKAIGNSEITQFFKATQNTEARER